MILYRLEQNWASAEAFPDTARNVIVQKLPFHLQDKGHHLGLKMILASDLRPTQTPIPTNLEAVWMSNRQHKVSVHITEITPSSDPSAPWKKSHDCDQMCLIPIKPHPWCKCCAFREKPIEDHKAFLKENNVCFKCCASSSHFSFKVQRSECESDPHHTGLHPWPPPWISIQNLLQNTVGSRISRNTNPPLVLL